MTSEELNAESPAVAIESVKLPPFWPSDPEVWFAQVEATFTARRIIAKRTKFSPEVATEMQDLILISPDSEPYNVLKEQLVKWTAASEQ